MTAPAAPRRILVRGPNPVGDLVMATGRFADLRRAFPAARITLALKPGRADVVAGLDVYDDLIVDDSHVGPARLWRYTAELRRRAFDLGVLFTNTVRAALTLVLADIPARVGYARGGQGALLTRAVEAPRLASGAFAPTPMTELYGRLAAAAGAETGDGWPRLAVGADLEARYREKRRQLGIGDGERLIGLVPGAAFGASKLWPLPRFAELADLLCARYGERAIIFFGPGEEGIAGELASRMRTAPIHTPDAPLGLALLKPFVRDLRLLVTTDTGPRHYATAFRVPAVVIMGPTHPGWTASCLDHQEIVRRDVPCGPCQLPICPLDHACMTGISPADVLERVEALERRPSPLRAAG